MKEMSAARKKRAVIALCLAFLCAFSACAVQRGRAKKAKKFTWLTMGTGDTGGSLYASGADIADALQKRSETLRFNLKASTGSPENMKRLLAGDVDLALITADVAAAAKNEPGGETLRVIGAVFPSVSQWMALEESGLMRVSDLKGLPVIVGPEGSATEYAARAALKALQVPEEGYTMNSGIGSGADLVLSGRAKAVHALSGIPAPGLEKLATAKKSTLLRYDAAEIQKILAAEPQYFATVIPKGSYPGQDEDIPSFGVKCLLCVRADMDEALVYQLTEQLYAALPDLSKKRPGFANVTDKDFYLGELPLPLHDGALRYYRDQGLTEEK